MRSVAIYIIEWLIYLVLRTACNKERMEADNQIESLFSHPENTVIVKLHLIVITAVEWSNDKADEGKKCYSRSAVQFWKPGKMEAHFFKYKTLLEN